VGGEESGGLGIEIEEKGLKSMRGFEVVEIYCKGLVGVGRTRSIEVVR
jgi:hypothetical protein